MRPLARAEGFSEDQWAAAGTFLIGIPLAVVAGMIVLYTRRVELAAIVALPFVLLMLSNYRLAVTLTVWAVLTWLLRLPAVFFDLVQFSYVVYATIALTMGAYLLR